MSDELQIFHYTFNTFNEDNENRQPKRRLPNMFISYRKEMMKHKPSKMPMGEYSRLVSKWWKQLSESDKSKWQRRYHISRDQNLLLPATKDEPVSKHLKKDCFLIEIPSKHALNSIEDF
ncbi:1828_t:CDS:1 [Funneliformis geosporum]|uniref:19541_t:CDS:1 n=1 Tax=Funneliformis geosporum TaxID=1117311 RepID=A0A9W4SKJ7_9GLOM|nr:1828_t:CDS:1 [Funneliformis geosporum]CAI2172490.1 19541_t:CDS:1 [Funneliformis geosporum]